MAACENARPATCCVAGSCRVSSSRPSSTGRRQTSSRHEQAQHVALSSHSVFMAPVRQDASSSGAQSSDDPPRKEGSRQSSHNVATREHFVLTALSAGHMVSALKDALERLIECLCT